MKATARNTSEYRTSQIDIRVVTKEMRDYSDVMRRLNQNKLHCFTFHPKLHETVKASIRHLAGDTPAEDISNELVALGFSVINICQMTASRPLPHGGSKTVNLPLFLVTFLRGEKSLEV